MADSQRQRRPLPTPASPRDVAHGPASPSASPLAGRPPRGRRRLTLAHALLLLAAVYALGLLLFLSRGLPRPAASLSRWWRGQALRTGPRQRPGVRFQDGDAVYADDVDAAGFDPREYEQQRLAEDADGDGGALGAVDLARAVRGADGKPLPPREILNQLSKIGPRVDAASATPRPTVDAAAVRAAVEHARHVQMLPPEREGDAPRRFRCVGWRATGGCSPFGPREPARDQPCTAVIPAGEAGYCEVQDKDSGELFRVMHAHCSSLVPGARLRCFEAWDFANFPLQARDAARAQLADQSGRGLLTRPEDPASQGVVMVVYPKLVPSAAASLRALRDLGCTLPVELWFRQDEAAKAPGMARALLRLQAEAGPLTLRAIDAREKRAVGFAAKIHAIAHSAFAQLLFLDADNAPALDPTFLFSSREFRATGALFWPDFWHPGHTIFNVHATSLVWELLGLRAVRMFEQESGQLLVDRARHAEPLALVNFYAFHRPSHLERLQLVWGDKDLFRLAWLKARAAFHMVQHPPAAAGLLLNGSSFCGVTMVQHDPQGRVLFLHRNAYKLLGRPREEDEDEDATRAKERKEREDKRRQVLAAHGLPTDAADALEDEDEDEVKALPAPADGLPDPQLWTHLLTFNGSRTSEYVIDIYKLPGLLPDWQSCYGRREATSDPHFELRSVQDLPFAGLEAKLRRYAADAAAAMGD